MKQHIDDFKNFLLNENLNQYTIYTENELKRYIKSLFNSSFHSSVKNIELSLSDKFMKIESKYRFESGSKSKDDLFITILKDDKFDEVLKNYLVHKYDNVTTKIENRSTGSVLYVYHS